eukprot:2786313-Amphidinium_carterae.1
MAGLRRVGAAAGLAQPAIALDHGKVLAVTDAYPHLGRYHNQKLKVTKEVRQRLVKSNAAFKEHERSLCSKQFTVVTRLQLLRCYVTCHLLQNSGVAPLLAQAEYCRLRTAYYHNIRRVVGQASNAHKRSDLNDEELCGRFSLFNFQTLVDRSRLCFLRRLLIVDAAPLQALLAADYGPTSIWSGMLSSLSNIHK